MSNKNKVMHCAGSCLRIMYTLIIFFGICLIPWQARGHRIIIFSFCFLCHELAFSFRLHLLAGRLAFHQYSLLRRSHAYLDIIRTPKASLTLLHPFGGHAVFSLIARSPFAFSPWVPTKIGPIPNASSCNCIFLTRSLAHSSSSCRWKFEPRRFVSYVAPSLVSRAKWFPKHTSIPLRPSTGTGECEQP